MISSLVSVCRGVRWRKDWNCGGSCEACARASSERSENAKSLKRRRDAKGAATKPRLCPKGSTLKFSLFIHGIRIPFSLKIIFRKQRKVPGYEEEDRGWYCIYEFLGNKLKHWRNFAQEDACRRIVRRVIIPRAIQDVLTLRKLGKARMRRRKRSKKSIMATSQVPNVPMVDDSALFVQTCASSAVAIHPLEERRHWADRLVSTAGGTVSGMLPVMSFSHLHGGTRWLRINFNQESGCMWTNR